MVLVMVPRRPFGPLPVPGRCRSYREATGGAPVPDIAFAMMRYALLDRTAGRRARRGGDRRPHGCLWGGLPALDGGGRPGPVRGGPPGPQPATLIVPDALKGKFDPHSGAHPGGLDDLGLGRRPTTPGWRRGRPTARCWCRGPARARWSGWPRSGRDGHLVTVLLDGLTQPHGLAFDGATLYVAESDQIRPTPTRRRGDRSRASSPTAFPTPSPPSSAASYAHALKTVAVGPDHALYFSIGSSGNISADDRDATRSGRRSCGSRRVAARPRSSPAACATAPGSRSRPTARSGPR